MRNVLVRKGLVIGIIVLFVITSIIPLVGSLSMEKLDSTEIWIWKSNSKDDTTPPVTTITLVPATLEGKNGWYISNVVVTLNATDDMSGVNVTYYRINNGEWETYSEPFILESDGYHVIEYYSVDNAGNIEDAKSSELKIDQTKPKIECYYDVFEEEEIWYARFSAYCSDALSDIDRVELYLFDELKYTANEWFLEYIVPLEETSIHNLHHVYGFICNPIITEEYVSIYAILIEIYSGYGWDFEAVAYDNAGNFNSDGLDHSFVEGWTFLFRQLELPPDYEGYIGKYYIDIYYKGYWSIFDNIENIQVIQNTQQTSNFNEGIGGITNE